ncbi:MAG: hypothetical protein IT374_07905 [Polyangiaceae bacterium]|nr:hypothetical protein [Polyangiaceae bacterium]
MRAPAILVVVTWLTLPVACGGGTDEATGITIEQTGGAGASGASGGGAGKAGTGGGAGNAGGGVGKAGASSAGAAGAGAAGAAGAAGKAGASGGAGAAGKAGASGAGAAGKAGASGAGAAGKAGAGGAGAAGKAGAGGGTGGGAAGKAGASGGLCAGVESAPFDPPGVCDGPSGQTSKEVPSNGVYSTSWFGCYRKSDGSIYKDPGDNCEFACGPKGHCPASQPGPECEATLKWFSADADRYGCGAKLRLTNCANGKRVILVALDRGPNCTSVEKKVGAPVLDMSHDAMVYLFDGATYGGNEKKRVVVEEVDAATPLGPE